MAEFDPFAAQFFFDHDFVASANEARLEIINPATLDKVGVIARCDDAEVDRMVARANEVQRDWARTDAKTRASLLHQVADSISRPIPRQGRNMTPCRPALPCAAANGSAWIECEAAARAAAGKKGRTTRIRPEFSAF